MNTFRRTESFILSETHHHYHISVSIPTIDSPDKGFPVLYILDGNAYFTMVDTIVSLQNRRSDKTGVVYFIIVSIGYEGDGFFLPSRFYDFTPPAANVVLPDKPDGKPWPEHGGGDIFLDFLEYKLQPMIQQKYPIDCSKQALFGHSLGGLFTIYTLFKRPYLFQSYLAFSPSIWWNNLAVLSEEKNVQPDKTKKLFIAVENTEQKKMYENAFHLYNRLKDKSILGELEFFSSDEENHMSIVPTALSKSLRFFLR